MSMYTCAKCMCVGVLLYVFNWEGLTEKMEGILREFFSGSSQGCPRIRLSFRVKFRIKMGLYTECEDLQLHMFF